MKVMVFLVVAVTAMQAGRTLGSPRTLPKGGVSREGERRLCGWRLANELNRVCKGVYNKPRVSTNTLLYRKERGGKRVDLWPLWRKLEWTQTPAGKLRTGQKIEPRPLMSPRLPFLSGAEASRVFSGSPRVKRGLSAECCRKACSVVELAGYCY